MKLSKEFAEIALQVGGSHYPDVGGDLLQKFGEELVRRCAQLADSDSSCPHETYGKMILDRFGVKQ
jgi:hypothetical protein